MSRSFHRPVWRPSSVLDEMAGSGDPAELGTVAHDTAAALVQRDERLRAFVASDGVDELAELWAETPAVSLPGALWRVYLVRQLDPAAPNAVLALVSDVLSGGFSGDLAAALDRVAAYYRERAERYAGVADELAASATLWRAGRLD